MTGSTVLYGLLLVVAGAAAILSFSALRDLALLCGFAPALAWLLPVVVDAGAAAGSLVWLGRVSHADARRFARTLALALLGLSVAANALGHALAAYRLAPVWWVVVAVSAIAPAVLGAVVHLAVLVGRPTDPTPPAYVEDIRGDVPDVWDVPGDDERDAVAIEAGLLDDRGLSRAWEHAPPAVPPTAAAPSPHEPAPGQSGLGVPGAVGPVPEPVETRAADLIAAGVGRRRLARALDNSEHAARQLPDDARNPHHEHGHDDQAANSTAAAGRDIGRNGPVLAFTAGSYR